MTLFNKTLYIHFYKVILLILITLIIILAINYFYVDNPKTSALFGGLTTGLIVAVIQLLLMYSDHLEIEKIKKLKIKKILPHRDDEKLYRDIIKQSEKEILVLGNTAIRFLQDFADQSRNDKRALLDALARNVKVKLLLPNPRWLATDDDKDKAKMSSRKIAELSKKYSNLFECKYYDHAPFHNLVMADDECLVGPIFPHISSKDSPAIYTDNSSIFVKPYLKYFEYEWEQAKPCKEA